MIKGYFTDSEYYGYVNGEYMPFESEEEYYKYAEEKENDK